MKKVIVLSGSIREGRKSHFVAQYVSQAIASHEGIEVTLLDLKEYSLPVMDVRMNALDAVPEGLQEFSNKLAEADGIVFVSPEYKNGIPGALKNALDYLNPQILKRIPFGVVTVSSGGFGGLLCLSQLRTVGLALGGIAIPDKLCVSKVNELFSEEGALLDESLQTKIDDFSNALLWYVGRF
ncbi:NAD(P)H-dependent oxidoreductase [Aureisphaera galaxeae]|uniref:NADPH-dependent FMN reductase n=1 Tax=Aureisphaera galaxeae TaxID=1538023 RepID=UPI0023509987|nr:NAD(P)H-dependent oxidoreductase [Aureisphaera galaxeae]MDC8005427.1 NAD(P)H-dependent oxidoreductase [Aureisphaera galaxeae]